MSVTVVAHLVSVAAATGVRASLGLLALAVGARLGAFELGGPIAWLSTNGGLALLTALAVIDELLEHDEDLREVVVVANVGIRGAAGAAAAWGIEGGLGGEAPGWLVWAIGFAIATGVHLLRARIHTALSGFGDGVHSPRTWLNVLETGGVLGIMVALAIAPIVVGVFVTLGILFAIVLVVIARVFEAHRGRRPCPHCKHRSRAEASRCPKCRNTIPVIRWRA